MNAGYGRVEVLHGIDLTVGEGELVTVIGANGAGKSTLLKAIVGLVPVRAGTVTYDGAHLTAPRPERLVRRGLALVPEGRLLFGPMSVAGEPRARRLRCRARATVRDRGGAGESARALPGARGTSGSAGRDALRRRAADAGRRHERSCRDRGCCCSTSRPSAWRRRSSPRSSRCSTSCARKASPSCSSSRTPRLALKHADRGYVMRTGRVVLEGTAGELLADESVRTIYLGAWRGEGEES